MSNFYIYEQIDDFSFKGKAITVTNLDTLPRYEQVLLERRLEYVVVKGLDIQAVGCAIIHPEDMTVYRNRLAGAVEGDEQILGRRKAGLKELERDMTMRLSKKESNEDEAGSKIEYREGDPHKPRQFYKTGQKHIIDG